MIYTLTKVRHYQTVYRTILKNQPDLLKDNFSSDTLISYSCQRNAYTCFTC